MRPFLENEENMDLIRQLLERHKKFVLDNLDEIDPEVNAQKTRFQKFWCWLIYGHLIKKGKCIRCGKIFTNSQTTTK